MLYCAAPAFRMCQPAEHRFYEGKEVAVASKGLKRLRKRVASSSSAQKVPLLGGLDPRLWRSMGSSGSMPKKTPSMPRIIGLIRVIWHLISLPFMTPCMSWGWNMFLLNQRSATSP
ncbi:hypothetical protein HAX54_030558 [Datura stramonium]|uniref:Uncharacterized protein n=1 Tax=Datura stramonium TaxID=4076 RepID=A0ABS8VBB2_DATST|nr:hypothetical protein [Datura stramonium]